MKEVRFSTKKGKDLVKRGNQCTAMFLNQLYDNWSIYKEEAYNWCYDQYANSEDRCGFGIGNANTFGFTASWFCTINGENAMRIETKDNSYIVWLDR